MSEPFFLFDRRLEKNVFVESVSDVICRIHTAYSSVIDESVNSFRHLSPFFDLKLSIFCFIF